MKRLFRLFTLGLLILTVLSSFNVFAQTGSDVEALVQGNTEFAIDLYKQINEKEGNIFFSPYSISTALAMTYAGARGETAEQMASVLRFSLEDEMLHFSFAEIQKGLDAVEEEGKIELSIANSLWPADKYPFLKEYLELARNYYGTEITPLDYLRNPEGARLKINSWVERETKDKINDILSGHPDPSTRLILANAIFFKGEWVSRFKKSSTKQIPFHLEKNETIEVPMMHQTSDLKYGENDFVQILEMPYAGNDLSMVIILPREIDGLQNVEEILSVDNLQEWSRNSYEEPVEVFFPRFTTTFQFDLKNVLKEMGMKDAFVTGKANFSGMDGNPDWLYIGFAVHKAFVDVNEEGTEAAAATVGGGCFPSGTEVLTVNGPRAIETVDTGTKVYAYNLATGRWVLKRVLKRSSYQYEGDMITILTGHITIHATGNHPFFVLYGDNLKARPLPQDVSQEEQRAIEYGRWVEARDLKEGDVLKDKNGEGLIITSLSSLPDKTEVYNLDIEDCHNYAVHQQGILVHNKGKKEVLPIMFRVDHPFLFLIRDNLTGSILFMGRVSSPR